MSLLYLTADLVGEQSGGGQVTLNEATALHAIDPDHFKCVDKRVLWDGDMDKLPEEPWGWDGRAVHHFGSNVKLCHIYSGTFSESARKLKQNGAKLIWTIAAHSIEASRKAHEDLGLDYPYTHLTDPELWKRYSAGYWMADVIICPSTYSQRTVQEQHQSLFGHPHPDVRVVEHGVDLPEKIAPLPKTFTVGYLGAIGPDKGLRYLIEAWGKLGWTDATLILAGKYSADEFVRHLIEVVGGGNIQLMGWVKDVKDFYDRISCYVQPSCSEGYGIEVLEAMAFGRSVICSTGAGASDLITDYATDFFNGVCFPVEDVTCLCHRLNVIREGCDLQVLGQQARKTAEQHTWQIIRSKYQSIYKEFLQ